MENTRLQNKAGNISFIVDELIEEIENLETLLEKREQVIAEQEEEIEKLKSRT